jgi:hypothetical protein
MVLAAERTELTHRGRRRVIGTLLVPAALLWLLAGD